MPSRAAAVGLVSLLWALSTMPAWSQSPAGALYQQAQAAEQAARAATPVSLDALRKVAKTYESLVLRYPTSGYCDNALWQAAGVMTTVFQQSASASDRQQAEHELKWLRQEYPSSPFVKQVDQALAALEPTDATPDAAAAPPAAAPPSAAAPPASGSSAIVRTITDAALPHGERVTIELSREVSYSGDRVDNPDRIFFDFTNAKAAASLADHVPLSGSLVKAVRVGLHAANVTRVVLELAGNPRYSAFPLYDPFRLVIDVESTDPALTTTSPTPTAPAAATTGGASAPKTPPSVSHTDADSPKTAKATATPTPTPPAAAPPAATTDSSATAKAPAPAAAGSPVPPSSNQSGDYSLSRQLGLTVSRIVIDAGHGGHDPGAQANGIDESELTLDVALRLQKLLEAQPGFAVVLTRSTDEYIALEERTAIANREGADLFLSIHANASKEPSAHGVETYFLNFATNPQAEAVAARENASSAQAMGELPEILKAIAMNNKLAESRELAASVQTALIRRLSAQNKSTRDLGVRQAQFVVLIGAQMPSVLAEISFLTNKNEASLLKQSSYRQRIAQALCDGIVKYQSSLKKVTTVAAKDGGR